MSSETSDVEARTSHRVAKETATHLRIRKAAAYSDYMGDSKLSGIHTPRWLAAGESSDESTPTEDGLYETGWM